MTKDDKRKRNPLERIIEQPSRWESEVESCHWHEMTDTGLGKHLPEMDAIEVLGRIVSETMISPEDLEEIARTFGDIFGMEQEVEKGKKRG